MNKNYNLICKNLSFKYLHKDENIIDDFSFSFEKGKFYLITGNSGCGKSTLAYVLAGLYPNNKGILNSGDVYVDGLNLKTMSIKERAKKITMMFQNVDTQFCMEDIENELIFIFENLDYDLNTIDEKIKEFLTKSGIYHLKNTNFSKLSGGEKQKAMLACLLAINSDIIVLDEPFTNVDYESSQEIIDVFIDLNNKKNTTFIIIDHQMYLWEKINYELIVLDNKCKIKNLSLESFLYKSFNINDDLTHSKNLIEIKNLNIEYDNNIIAKDLNLCIQEGKITSIIGKNGCGKTSLLSILAKIKKYNQGSILYKGKQLKDIKQRDFLNKVGIVFQNPKNQFIKYKVIDEILFSLNKFNKNDKNLEKAQYLLEKFNLYKFKDKSPYLLSQGQQRKLAVLSMLCCDQELLLCDEPTYGQDINTSVELMQYLLEKINKTNLSVVFVSHDINLIKDYSHNIYKM